MVAKIADLLSIESELLRTYIFYSCVLVLKVLAMAGLTAVQRFKHKSFTNPEDAKLQRVKPRVDENVERVRRAHLNDLENIPVFFVASFAYILTNPAVGTATLLFRVFTAARIVHTLVYAVVPTQPARALAYFAGLLITIYMAVQGILHFL